MRTFYIWLSVLITTNILFNIAGMMVPSVFVQGIFCGVGACISVVLSVNLTYYNAIPVALIDSRGEPCES